MKWTTIKHVQVEIDLIFLFFKIIIFSLFIGWEYSSWFRHWAIGVYCSFSKNWWSKISEKGISLSQCLNSMVKKLVVGRYSSLICWEVSFVGIEFCGWILIFQVENVITELNKTFPADGLLPIYINPHRGTSSYSVITFGAMGDRYGNLILLYDFIYLLRSGSPICEDIHLLLVDLQWWLTWKSWLQLLWVFTQSLDTRK